jgi:hypothetical protein
MVDDDLAGPVRAGFEDACDRVLFRTTSRPTRR